MKTAYLEGLAVMLTIANASVQIGRNLLFSDVSFEINRGKLGLIMAPSGAGKTTLLRWIAGLDINGLSAAGALTLDGERIDKLPAERRRVGFLFQSPLLFPHLTVSDNLAFGLSATVKGPDRKAVISDALETAGLGGFELRDPDSLSGGQQSRVALLRALLAQPRALLLDEPFASLDDLTRDNILSFLAAEVKRRDIPVLLVSHDPRDRDMGSLLPATTIRLTSQNGAEPSSSR